MPGIAAAIISAIVVASAGNAGFAPDYFPAVANYLKMGDMDEAAIAALSDEAIANYGKQAVAQILCLITTLAISIFAGLTGGWMCSLSIW